MAKNEGFEKLIKEHGERLEKQSKKSQAARNHAQQALEHSRAARRKREDFSQAAVRVVREATEE